MMLSLILLSIVFSLIALFFWTTNNRYDYFKRRGISGPPHQFFFRHYKTFWSTKYFSQLIQQWTQQYGSVYGLFLGRTPMYVVSDVDFLQEVYIKQFSSFHSRELPKVLQIETDGKIHLFRSNGARWRRQRHVLNPTFSAAKLKLMSPLVNGCIEALLNKVSQMVNSGESQMNIYELYKRLTMDVICRCAFGIDTDMQNDVNHVFLIKSAEVFKIDPEQIPLIRLSNLIPILARPFHDFFFWASGFREKLIEQIPALNEYLKEAPAIWLLKRIDEVINLRKKSNLKNRADLLQLMMDVSTNDKVIDHADEALMSKLLNIDETLANIFVFMVAGYETTSTALAYSTYVLATKPDIQEKLVKEINQNNWKNLSDTEVYDLVTNLTYLDFFVREVLRMYTITVKAMARICNTSTTVCGYSIEEGSVIQPDVRTIHYNPDLWGPEDPNVFYPERHADKRHPVAWMPFGVGPRSCIGTRFALMELKMCLIRLLRLYEILPGEKIEEGFQVEERAVIQPNAIFVKLEKRAF